MRETSRSIGLWALVALVGALLVAAPAAGADPSSEGEIEIVSSASFGDVDGVSFSAYACRFSGEADALSYTRADSTTGSVAFDVGCSIILPTDLAHWNGRIAVEPLDAFTLGVPLDFAGFFRQVLLTDEAFFGAGDGGRWGYAIVSYFGGNAGEVIDQPPTDLALGVYPAASLEILADYADVLGGDNGVLFGVNAESVVGMGLSNQGAALRGVLALAPTLASTPFDASLVAGSAGITLVVDPTNTVAFADAAAQNFGTQRALFLDTESEVAPNGTLDVYGLFPILTADVATEVDEINRFRYELAGASHLDRVNQLDIEAVALVPPGTFDDSNPLPWTAILRGLFARIDTWLIDGTPPPPSRFLDRATTPGLVDPAYPGHPSVLEGVVERNEDLNAKGGLRLPNVELGVGTYRAIGPPIDFSDDFIVEFFQWLAGGFEDLRCTPRSDGSPRFRNHGQYVSQYRAATMALVSDGFIEMSDATDMISTAARTDIGKCSR